jgi:O-antigen ligase
MKKIFSKIKNLSLEEINKNLLLVAVASLFFRSNSLATSHLLNPFEIFFFIVVILTFFDFLKNKKFKEFFNSIPKNILISVFILIFSILFGWLISIFINKIEFNYNMISEFGTFIISIITFLFILFYTKKDNTYIKKYLYALLIPSVYIIFTMFPQFAIYLNVIHDGLFYGFSNNVNIISKILLIPTIFFITKSLLEINNRWFKFLYIFISSLLFTLLLWSNQRGALLGLFIGVIFIYFFISYFNYKKSISSLFIIIFIFLLGFLFSLNYSRNFVLNRIIETTKISYQDLLDNSKYSSEDRFEIWPFYLKYSLNNPFGIGPNTHMNALIYTKSGIYENPGPHNTYLQFLLWGGVTGLFSFLYIIFDSFKNLNKNIFLQKDYIFISLFGILISLLISMIFNDSISIYCFWVVLALLLRYKNESNN